MSEWSARIRIKPRGRVHAAAWDQAHGSYKTACGKWAYIIEDEVDEDESCKACRRAMAEAERRRGW